MIRDKAILFVSTLGFSDLPTRKQRIAEALSHYNRVIYLEPPSTMLARILRKGLPKAKSTSLVGRLTTIRLPDILPFGLKYHFVQKINEKVLHHFLQKVFRDFDFTPEILWTYLVDFPGLYRVLAPQKIVYDCVDDHSSYAGLRSPRFVNQLEEQVSRESDVCFATTQELVNKILPYQSNTHLVTNGVDIELFLSHSKLLPKDLEGIKTPIIGYFGAIQEWFDDDLIYETAKKRPDLSFVLVGPYREATKVKLNLPNIYLLGRKPYEEAPAYINAFDVCLIPFIPSDLTLNISPLKFYEYCSLGKPTVSIPVKQMLPLSALCYLYTNQSEFMEGINKALLEDKNVREKRTQVARDNDWNAKFTFMFEQVSAV
jgi:hypothetical protein